MSLSKRYVGMDLGSTTTVLFMEDKFKTVKSVAVRESGAFVCGEAAEALKKASPGLPFFSETKRFIRSNVLGESTTPEFHRNLDVLRAATGATVTQGIDGSVSMLLDDMKLVPKDIMKQIATAAMTMFAAENKLDMDSCYACGTYPAHFNLIQKITYREILLEGAGFNVKRFMMADEASAAVIGAMILGLDLGEAGEAGDPWLVAMLDVGGSTFDVSVVEIRGAQTYTMLTPLNLGGCPDTAGKELKDMLRIRAPGATEAALDKAAIDLCTMEFVSIESHGQSVVVTQQQFKDDCAPLMEKMLQSVRDVLDSALETGVERQQLAAVVLCGGASRVGMIQEMARVVASEEECRLTIVPDGKATQLVALGAEAIARSAFEVNPTHSYVLRTSSQRPYSMKVKGVYLTAGADQVEWEEDLAMLNKVHPNKASYDHAWSLAETLKLDEHRRVDVDACTEKQKKSAFLYDLRQLLPSGWVHGAGTVHPSAGAPYAIIHNVERVTLGNALFELQIYEGFGLSAASLGRRPVAKMALPLSEKVVTYFGDGRRVEAKAVKMVTYSSLGADGILVVQVKYVAHDGADVLSWSDNMVFDLADLDGLSPDALTAEMGKTKERTLEQIYEVKLNICRSNLLAQHGSAAPDVLDKVFSDVRSGYDNMNMGLRMFLLDEYMQANGICAVGYEVQAAARVQDGGSSPPRSRSRSRSRSPPCRSHSRSSDYDE